MLERLDPAVLPHFQFRLKLKTLRTDQLMMLFKQPFGRDTSTDEEAVLRSLATDFANIPVCCASHLNRGAATRRRKRRFAIGEAEPIGFTTNL